jgi:hypothetical protein
VDILTIYKKKIATNHNTDNKGYKTYTACPDISGSTQMTYLWSQPPCPTDVGQAGIHSATLTYFIAMPSGAIDATIDTLKIFFRNHK